MNINVSSSTNDFTTALFDLRPVWHVKGRSIIRARDTNVIRCSTQRHLYRNHRNRTVQSHLSPFTFSLDHLSYLVRYIYIYVSLLETLFLNILQKWKRKLSMKITNRFDRGKGREKETVIDTPILSSE